MDNDVPSLLQQEPDLTCPENLIGADGTHTDIVVARALAMVRGVDACEHARPS